MRTDITRYRLRTRLASVLLVALLATIVGAAIATAVAGARRTDSAALRLQAASGEHDALIDATEVDPAMWDRIDDLPSVTLAGPASFTFAVPADDPDAVAFYFMANDDVLGRRLAQGYLSAGRRVDPGADDEVALSEESARRAGLGVGDTLRLATYSPEQAEQLATTGVGELDGPELRLEIVGLTRSTLDVAAPGDTPTIDILTSGVFDRYRDEVGRADGLFFVRLTDGADLEVLGQDLRAAFPEGQVPRIDPGGSSIPDLGDSLRVLTWGLYAFAAVAALFGLAVVSQAISRAVARDEPNQFILAGVGMTRRERFLEAWIPLLGAAVAAAAGSVGLAVVASSRMPIGLARRIDPSLGVDVDLPALVGVAAVVSGVVAGLGALACWRLASLALDRSTASISATARPKATALARSAPPTVAVGVGMATVKGRRPEAVAVRTATVGVAVAMIGIAAVVVFGASMARLLDTPTRYGWEWDLAVKGDQPAPEELASSDLVDAVSTGVFNETAIVGGESVNVMGLETVAGDIGAAIVEGEEPSARDEVALGAATQQALDHPDEVTALDAEGGEHRFRVVGTMAMPSLDDPIPVADGALFTLDGLRVLGMDQPAEDSAGFTATALRLRDDVDPDVAAAELGIADDALRRPTLPTEVERLDQVSALPQVLALFLAGLALLAVGNALWQTVRYRSREFAVLRALGFERSQVVGVVAWQAAVVAAIGVAVGTPIGLALGRWAWTLVAESVGVATDPLTPATALVSGVMAVAVAVVAGVTFGLVAARRTPATALHEA